MSLFLAELLGALDLSIWMSREEIIRVFTKSLIIDLSLEVVPHSCSLLTFSCGVVFVFCQTHRAM